QARQVADDLAVHAAFSIAGSWAGGPALPSFSASFLCEVRGQNHPTRAMAGGIEPHTTAHSLKIDQTNMAPIRTAVTSGQKVGWGEPSRTSGLASTTLVSSTSRVSTHRPSMTLRPSLASHSGSRPSTTGT